MLANIVGVGFAKEKNAINEPTNAEKTDSKQINNTHSCFAFVEFVCAKVTQEQAKEKCDPLVSHSYTKNGCVDICICIGVVICIVDDNAGLIGLLYFFDLTSAIGANNGSHRDFLTAMLTKFCIFLCRSGILSSGVVVHRYIPLFYLV